MAPQLGYVGQLILSEAPIPAPVRRVLAGQFGELVARNGHLTDAERVEWLSNRPPANIAVSLCDHTFSPAALTQVLEAENRRGPIKSLAEANRSAEALTEILSRPFASPAAPAGVKVAGVDRRLILDHFDAMKSQDQALALLHCDHNVSDTEIAARVASMDQVLPRGKSARRRMLELFDSLVCYRPGLTAELRTHGHPHLIRAAVASSPWIGEEDPAALLDAERGALHNIVLQRRLAENPWTRIEDIAAQVSDEQASVSVATRRGSGAELSESPLDLNNPGDVRIAWLYSFRRMDPAPMRLDQLQLLLAWNENLNGHFAGDIANRIRYIHAWLGVVPAWVLEATKRQFHARYPEHLDAPAEDAPSRPEPPTPPNPRSVRRLFVEKPAADLDDYPAELRQGALALLAETLGDDADAWTAAVLVGDSVDGTLAELAGVALATAVAA